MFLKKKNISGKKYLTKQGCIAIKDGIKTYDDNQLHIKKPLWLKKRQNIFNIKNYFNVKQITTKNNLSTVCEEAKCPNIHECWSNKTATIMLLGKVCTRACKFCSVDTGNPKGWIDHNEPINTAKSIKLMNLKYVVLTSVNRDDLKDHGSNHYVNTINSIKNICPDTNIEVLSPDFQGNIDHLDKLLKTNIDVFAQNIETVKRLTHDVRDTRSGYLQTLNILKYVKYHYPKIFTKTSLMLGLGEEKEEILQTIHDLRKKSLVDILTLGQYMQPTINHLKIKRFITKKEFNEYREFALKEGFLSVLSGPFIRSSYRADKLFKEVKLKIDSTHNIK